MKEADNSPLLELLGFAATNNIIMIILLGDGRAVGELHCRQEEDADARTLFTGQPRGQ